MAKKTAVVDIKLTGLDSIEELERDLEAVNQQLLNLNSNVEAFKTLTGQADEATGKIQEINDELSNVSGGDAASSVESIGETITDAFKDGGDAINDFTEVAAEGMTEVVDNSENVRDAIGVISKVGKTFTTAMGGELRGLSKGFTVMGQSAKVAGASIKASLAAAGIGILLGVLTLLIQNWDKLKKAITTTRKEKELFERQKGLQEEADYVAKMTEEYEKQYDAQKKINESQGNKEANTEVDLELNEKKTDELEKQNALLKNQSELADIQAQNDDKKFNKALKNSNSILGNAARILLYGEKAGIMEAKRLGILAEQATASDRQANILKEQITTNEKLLELTQEQSRVLQNQKNTKGYLENIDAQIAALENSNELLEAEGERTKDIYANNQKIVSLKKQRLEFEILIKENEEASDKIARDRLTTEAKANKIANDRRVTELKSQYATNLLSTAYYNALKEVNVELEIERRLTDETVRSNDEKLELLYQEIDATQRIADLNDYRTQAQIKAFPFDKKGLEILKETLGLRSDEIKILEEFEGINVNVAQLSQRIKLEYLNRVQALNAMHEKQLEILQTEKETNDATIQSLENQKIVASIGIYQAEKLSKYADEMITNWQQLLNAELALPDSKKNWEKIAEYQREITEYTNEKAKYDSDIAGYQNDIYQAQQGINALNLSNLQIDGEINAENENYLNQQKQITYELETQLRLYARMQEFLGKYAEEIAATQQLINQTFEFVSSLYDRQAQEATDKMKDLEKELKKLENREENIKELKEELKDADGERYDNLLALIAQEEQAETDKNQTIQEQKDAINAQIAEQENKKMEAEYQAAKWRKVQGIVDATIAGALATIKALPNVVLAGITAALSAVNIGIIAAQKLPERPPKQALGGYQEGNSHALGGKIVEVEGGEYIINKKSTAQYLPLIEAINNSGIRKYAEGGSTAPVNTSLTPQLFDYDKLAEAILSGIQPTVSVVEINRMQHKVRVLQNNARI